ncbi:GRAS family transcription factor [Euphorbia peplus]|nr:GRAS family transcription factor [Euphorbia peplus]
MAKTMLSFAANGDQYRPMSRSFQTMDRTSMWESNCSNEVDEWGMKSMDSEFYEADFVEEKSFFKYDQIHFQHQDQNQNPDSYMDSEVLYDQRLDVLSEQKKVDRNTFSMASIELLKKYGNSMSNGARMIDETGIDSKLSGEKLSTEEIIRIAGARFIQSYSQVVDIASMLNNPFGLSFSNLSDLDSANVELVELLLASAEKVGYQQFERASRLLNHCDSLCSDTGNPVQRVVYYFSKALQDRIDRETGRISLKVSPKKASLNPNQANPEADFRCYQKIPFFQVARFTGIEAILENVARAKRIHIIDLDIRYGAQWPILMQALQSRHDCPLELLKISAIGTSSKASIEDTGRRLASFARSMNIPFSFKAIMVSDLLELKEDLFDKDPGESVAIYSEYSLMSLITAQNRLEHVMMLLRKMNPCVMVVMETEASTNSQSFVNRFVEALFFYSAYFDCFDACIDRNDPNRRVTESIFFHHGIKNIVASEGKERWVRHVKLDVWRSFFARFRMKEIELSPSSLYQANLLLKQFASGSFCTLHMNDKCLLIGWKGTPIHSLSVWKFI